MRWENFLHTPLQLMYETTSFENEQTIAYIYSSKTFPTTLFLNQY